MSRRIAFVLCGLSMAASLAGCASQGMGMNKSNLFGRNQQWEPEVEPEETVSTSSDWKKAPSSFRKSSGKSYSEDPIEKLISSDQAREINRSLDGSF
jgi:hypothetical protein